MRTAGRSAALRDLVIDRPHQRDEFVVDDLDDLLGRDRRGRARPGRRALASTRAMKSLTTLKLTSASRSARRTSRRPSRMLSAVSRPRPRSFLNASHRPRVMPSNMRRISGKHWLRSPRRPVTVRQPRAGFNRTERARQSRRYPSSPSLAATGSHEVPQCGAFWDCIGICALPHCHHCSRRRLAAVARAEARRRLARDRHPRDVPDRRAEEAVARAGRHRLRRAGGRRAARCYVTDRMLARRREAARQRLRQAAG